jgi:hypothetical protein
MECGWIKAPAHELAHPHVPITLQDGSLDRMPLHIINGTPDDMKARLLENADAFVDICAES